MEMENKHKIKKIIVSTKCTSFCGEHWHDQYDIEISQSFKMTLEYILEQDKRNVILTVLIITPEEYEQVFQLMNTLDYSRIYYQLVIVDNNEELNFNNIKRLYHISDITGGNISDSKKKFIIDKSFSIIEKYFKNEQRKKWFHNKLMDSQNDQEDLINIGKSLSAEKDLDNLLRLILSLSKKITGADAGSIYLVEKDQEDHKRLRFKYSHTQSRDIPIEEFTMEINKNSISGYVATTGEVLNIPNAYDLDPLAPYSFNPYIDKEYNYISRSMLVVPMKNHRDEIIGVIQLINSKEDLNSSAHGNEAYLMVLKTKEDFDNYVVTFDHRYDSLLQAIAGQAAVAMENSQLIHQIQMQFEEFVKASISAIESRDPATSGHSFRVANICLEIAKEINRTSTGPLAETTFSENELKELEFAALLHDFGKVYIDLNIFKKAKKLFPQDLENLILRLDYLYRFTELKFSKKINNLRGDLSNNRNKIKALWSQEYTELNRISEIKNEIISLNEPAYSEIDPTERLTPILRDITQLECESTTGDKMQILTEENITNLSIRKGSLNAMERKEIESHVTETYNFVSKIPWPPEYANIPEIALRHHELLDGSGYPDGIKGKELLTLQSRIMTVADIFDALSAHDRHYKKSVPLEKCLAIIEEEADKGKLDSDVVKIFIDRKIYEKVL